jgi:hypothetical protein
LLSTGDPDYLVSGSSPALPIQYQLGWSIFPVEFEDDLIPILPLRRLIERVLSSLDLVVVVVVVIRRPT